MMLILLSVGMVYAQMPEMISKITPEMTLGIIGENHSIGLDILRALRSAIFIALAVLCFKAIKNGSKLAIIQSVWLISTAVLSFIALNANRYVSAPDFSYFSVFTFLVVGIHVYSAIEYLRRIIVGHNNIGLFDNIILVVAVLGISIIAMIGFKSSMLAADILLFAWSAIIVIGAITAIYFIVDKHSDIDLPILGWVPTQVGLIVALGVGTQGGSLAVITSITAWSSVVIGHLFLAFLTYFRYLEKKPHSTIQHGYGTDLLKLDAHDSVSMIVDRAVFRVKNDKKKIILNENCARMLQISGCDTEFSIEAFKGLIDSAYHGVIDKMLINKCSAPELIKFHVCNHIGFVQALQFQVDETHADTIFVYQEMQNMKSISEQFQPAPAPQANIPQQDTMPHADTAGGVFKERRQSSDIMHFINNSVAIIKEQNHETGHYALLFLEVQHHDDWQVILGVSEAYHLMKQVTEIIEECLRGFDNLFVKNFSGNFIGIFCHVVDANEAEIERLKSIITKKFEMPIAINDYKIFVNFHYASAKQSVAELSKNLSEAHLTHLMTSSMDVARRNISMNKETIVIDSRDLALPEGSNLIQLSSDLRYAPERNQINAYYTPIVDLKEGSVIGFNIDPVWRHPTFNVIKGDLLHYLSHRCAMENTLNRLVIAKSIEGMMKLYREKKLPIMSFPISKKRLLGANLDEEIKTLCNTLYINPSLIRLEFSPDCLTDNPKWLASILNDLKAIGVITVLNDFGSAKGQLAALAELAFDRVIIDSEFAENVSHNERHFFALKSLTTMLKDMSIEADMKNISSHKSFQKLYEAGISNISGSAIGIMMPAERAVNLLTKNYEVQ
jgi:EAL domain-containing protein (putative c-di-GMP-specific phosphodiesterase class I)/dUTPase